MVSSQIERLITQTISRYAQPLQEEVLRIIPFLKKNKFKKGAHLLRAGELAKDISIISKGLVRGYYSDSNGNEFTKAFDCKHDVIANIRSHLKQEPSRQFFQAIEDTEIYSIDFETFGGLCEKSIFWERLYSKVMEQEFLERENREYMFLVKSAEERYQEFLKQFPNIANRLNGKLIASFIGVAPETLSRLRAKLLV